MHAHAFAVGSGGLCVTERSDDAALAEFSRTADGAISDVVGVLGDSAGVMVVLVPYVWRNQFQCWQQ
jgi:hypothetical protein